MVSMPLSKIFNESRLLLIKICINCNNSSALRTCGFIACNEKRFLDMF